MMFDPSTLVYNDAGLIPAVAQDSRSKDVLMMAWMNEEAVKKTFETGKATYWSRSRKSFWVKGETSGHTQKVVDIRIDCDRDCILLLVEQVGSACHTNRMSCFYTTVQDGEEQELMSPLQQQS
jgi:phosphoribosyl-AMP cyclohydrolase